ncbi:hypothetical protein D3C87_1693600 [compost metagenome]
MKKITLISLLLLILLGITFSFSKSTYAVTEVKSNENTNIQSQLVELKEDSLKSLEDYKEKYGSDVYGITAYALNLIRIYSIPFCFLGIAISGIYQYIIGIRKLDVKEKGLVLMVTFITLLVICQILPLAFAIVVKFGRG